MVHKSAMLEGKLSITFPQLGVKTKASQAWLVEVSVTLIPKISLTMKTEKQKLTITTKLTITEHTYPFPQSLATHQHKFQQLMFIKYINMKTLDINNINTT